MSETYVVAIRKMAEGKWRIHFMHNGLKEDVTLYTGAIEAVSGGMRVDFATAIRVAWEHTPATEKRLIEALVEIKKECGIPSAQRGFNYSQEQHEILEQHKALEVQNE